MHSNANRIPSPRRIAPILDRDDMTSPWEPDTRARTEVQRFTQAQLDTADSILDTLDISLSVNWE